MRARVSRLLLRVSPYRERHRFDVNMSGILTIDVLIDSPIVFAPASFLRLANKRYLTAMPIVGATSSTDVPNQVRRSTLPSWQTRCVLSDFPFLYATIFIPHMPNNDILSIIGTYVPIRALAVPRFNGRGDQNVLPEAVLVDFKN